MKFNDRDAALAAMLAAPVGASVITECDRDGYSARWVLEADGLWHSGADADTADEVSDYTPIEFEEGGR